MQLIDVSSKRTLYKYLAYQGRRNCKTCKEIIWDKNQDADNAYCHKHKSIK